MKHVCLRYVALTLLIGLCLGGAWIPSGAVDSDQIASITLPDAVFEKEQGSVADAVMGNIAADAVRTAAGTDIAVIPCGDFSGADVGVKKFTQSDAVTMFSCDEQIAVTELTAAELFVLLEHAVASVALDEETKRLDFKASLSEQFLQISGFEFVYDSTAPVGSRIYSVSMDGKRLEKDGDFTLTLATGMSLLEGEYGYSLQGGEMIELCYSEALWDFLSKKSVITEYDSGRIRAIGNTEDGMLAQIPSPVLAILAGAILFSGMMVACIRREQLFEEKLHGFGPKYNLMK